MGIRIPSEKNALGDELLVATAIKNRIPIAISDDKHVFKLARRYGLICENPGIRENGSSSMGLEDR